MNPDVMAEMVAAEESIRTEDRVSVAASAGPALRVLVVRTDRIGDVVLTTPAIRALRQAYPGAHIAMLVAPSTRALVDGNPDLDDVLVDDRRGRHQGLGFWRLVNEVRRKKFDLAVIFHTKRRTNLLCFLAGIPVRIGYKNDKFGFLLTEQIPDDRPAGIKHESEYCLDMLRPLGVSLREGVGLFVPRRPECDQWVAEILAKAGLGPQDHPVAVHPRASCPTKRWPLARFVELIQSLQRRYGCPVILVGDAAGRRDARQIVRQLSGPVVDLTGATSIGQLASLLRSCQLLVSNDSGPVHIADAVGTPVVSIFTRNQPGINPGRWRPLGSQSRVVAPVTDPRLSFAMGEVKDPAFLERVTVEEVLAAVDEVYKLC